MNGYIQSLSFFVIAIFAAPVAGQLSAQLPAAAELDSASSIATADLAVAVAERDLADWKLGQLRRLRDDGHASWQEVAEQEVLAVAASARAEAANRYLKTVDDWRRRCDLQNSHPPESSGECIRLFMPGSPRLIAWVPIDVASRDLLQRHQGYLRAQLDSAHSEQIGSLGEAVKKSERRVVLLRRSEANSRLVRRAEIQLRLDQAMLAAALARKDQTPRIEARIDAVQKRLVALGSRSASELGGLAEIGTPFLSADSDPGLAAAVKSINAFDLSHPVGEQRIEHRLSVVEDCIASLESLEDASPVDHEQLNLAVAERQALIAQLKREQSVVALKKHLEDHYKTDLEGLPVDETPRDQSWLVEANAIRHLLEVERLAVTAETQRVGVRARRDYLIERRQRLAAIPETARPPKELQYITSAIRSCELDLDSLSQQCLLARQEAVRFQRQVRLPVHNTYQLVQSVNGQFLTKAKFRLGQAMIATVGWLGHSGPIRFRLSCIPYVESAQLMERLTPLPLNLCGVAAIIPVSDEPRAEHRTPIDLSPGRATRTTLPGPSNTIDSRFDWSYGLRRTSSADDCPPSLRSPLSPYDPTDRFAFETRISGFAARSRCPSYPVKESYLFQSAFPARSNLYTSPYSRPNRAYKGFGDAWEKPRF